jgi:(2S)-methylsuccinyl-CoA dehydrogenase
MLHKATRHEAGLKLVVLANEAVRAANAVRHDAIEAVRARVAVEGQMVERLFEREQRATHGLAWLATTVEAVRQLTAYAERLYDTGGLGEVEELVIEIGLGEYLAQIAGGIPMNQSEFARPADVGLDAAAVAARMAGPLAGLISEGNVARRERLVNLMRRHHDATVGDCGLDETHTAIRDEMRKFADSEVAPMANEWHLLNHFIPLTTVAHMAELGVFGVTVPQAHGGMGLGKEAMCVVAEELSRGYVGVGSLGTRSDIASELILAAGTEEQKRKWLPRIASGALLPTAAFTEPDSGSDLAAIKTRAVRHDTVYRVTGNKTFITHGARADLVVLLARTSKDAGHHGLSLFLAEKPRGTDEDPFPVRGLSGSEVWVLGYRGMKEYEIAFDGFEVKAENLLGGVEGMGFKQLMATFESSRIQTAARALGVAQAAMEAALTYALTRQQFGQAIINFPRIADKLALMAAEIMLARQLTYFAARQKDAGRRCDLEAGMAKLLAARVAWSAADNAVQIHGGNGYAVEYPVSRLLCDARVFSIFEGTAEIQAQVIARRVLEAR